MYRLLHRVSIHVHCHVSVKIYHSCYVLIHMSDFSWPVFCSEFFFPVEEGKLATGEIPLHDGNHLKWIHRIFMGGYLLITNVLLINLLIAIFRYRVERFKYNISVRKIIIRPLQLTDRLTTYRQRHTDRHTDRLTRRHTHRHAHTRTRRHTDWLTDDGEAGMAQ